MIATQPYRLVGRLKNNRLWSAILATFPAVRTQADAARELGITQSQIGELLNGTHWPCRNGAWSRVATRLAVALHTPEEYLFDPDLYGKALPRVDVELVYGPRAMKAGAARLALPPAQEDGILRREQRDAIKAALKTLTPRRQRVIEMRFGLDDGEERTLSEVAEAFGIGTERVRQIEAQALRNLRHPSRSRLLREYA